MQYTKRRFPNNGCLLYSRDQNSFLISCLPFLIHGTAILNFQIQLMFFLKRKSYLDFLIHAWKIIKSEDLVYHVFMFQFLTIIDQFSCFCSQYYGILSRGEKKQTFFFIQYCKFTNILLYNIHPDLLIFSYSPPLKPNLQKMKNSIS